MNQYEIISSQEASELSTQVTQFEQLLTSWGLPSENIIASMDERENIMKMLPDVISKIPEEQRSSATYLSRFIAGSAIGLFDAALNYVWDEVVVNLRNKIVYYGLDTFFDSACGTSIRDQYKSADDLSGIKDKTMLETLHKLEWISDVVYLKLSHILDMRNQIGASHPNSYNINSYELVGWLTTCVKEVINDKPSPYAIRTKQIIDNIKTLDTSIDINTVNSFEEAVKDLSSGMASTLLTSLFGLYVSDSSSAIVRSNILTISKVLWEYCKKETKYDIGEKKTLYKNNLNRGKEELTQAFLEYCGGLAFLTLSERSINLSDLCDKLILAHNGWDNFYNEVPYARDIMKYISKSNDIPLEREEKVIKSMLKCRIGREVDYRHGVSPGAQEYYDEFIKLLDKRQVIILLEEFVVQLRSLYSDNIRGENAANVLILVKSPVLGDRLNEIIDYILSFHSKKMIHKVVHDQGFKDLCKGIISL